MKYALSLSCLLLYAGCFARERAPQQHQMTRERSMVRLVAGGALGMLAAGFENSITSKLSNNKENRFYIRAYPRIHNIRPIIIVAAI